MRVLRLMVLAVIVTLSASALGSPLLASAQTSKTTKAKGGVTIAPAIQSLTITPADTALRFDFSVTNNTNEIQDYELSLVDFGSLDETGGILFVGLNEKSLQNYKYGLAAWAQAEQDVVTVKPKSTIKVPIVINNDDTLAPGGHYGAVLVSPAASVPVGGAKVQVNQIASALIFATKQGGEKYELGLENFDINSNLLNLPEKVNMRFHNTGNVHAIPRGIISLTDPRGRMVRKGIINTESGLILPETFRRLSSPLTVIERAWIPGKYQLTVSYRLDNQTALQIETVTLFYVNAMHVAAGIVVVGALLAIAFSRRFRNMLFRIVTNPKKLVSKSPKKR